MEVDRKFLLPETDKNRDIYFLLKKFDVGRFGLLYWISNDSFADGIRTLMERNEPIDAQSVYHIMQEVYSGFENARKETHQKQPFNFSAARKTMKQIKRIADSSESKS